MDIKTLAENLKVLKSRTKILGILKIETEIEGPLKITILVIPKITARDISTALNSGPEVSHQHD